MATNKLTAYAVTTKGEQDYFTRIGVAFPHKDGKGFNLVLEAFPVNGKIVVLPEKPKSAAAETAE